MLRVPGLESIETETRTDSVSLDTFLSSNHCENSNHMRQEKRNHKIPTRTRERERKWEEINNF